MNGVIKFYLFIIIYDDNSINVLYFIYGRSQLIFFWLILRYLLFLLLFQWIIYWLDWKRWVVSICVFKINFVIIKFVRVVKENMFIYCIDLKLRKLYIFVCILLDFMVFFSWISILLKKEFISQYRGDIVRLFYVLKFGKQS